MAVYRALLECDPSQVVAVYHTALLSDTNYDVVLAFRVLLESEPPTPVAGLRHAVFLSLPGLPCSAGALPGHCHLVDSFRPFPFV